MAEDPSDFDKFTSQEGVKSLRTMLDSYICPITGSSNVGRCNCKVHTHRNLMYHQEMGMTILSLSWYTHQRG